MAKNILKIFCFLLMATYCYALYYGFYRMGRGAKFEYYVENKSGEREYLTHDWLDGKLSTPLSKDEPVPYWAVHEIGQKQKVLVDASIDWDLINEWVLIICFLIPFILYYVGSKIIDGLTMMLNNSKS